MNRINRVNSHPQSATATTAAGKKPAVAAKSVTKTVAKTPAAPAKAVAPKAKPVPAASAKTPAAKAAPVAPAAVVKSTKLPKPPKAQKAPKLPKAPKAAKLDKPIKTGSSLVRDSFTMPEDDFKRIATLKARALQAQRPAKKSELLRAGLQVLEGLSAAALVDVLNRLVTLKPGRPKKHR